MQNLYKYCKRCGKRLKTLENMLIGYGPTCYKKIQKSRENKRLLKFKK